MDIKTEVNMEQAILDMAEKLFIEKGFDATSTVQIAKAVGCNQALVHYYFRTKENLFNTIFESKFRLFFQKIFDLSHLENMNFSEKISYFASSHFDLLVENPYMPRLILNELSRKPESIKVLREKLHSLPEILFAQLNKDLQIEIAAGKVRNVDLLDILITVISMNVALFTLLPVAVNIIGMNSAMKDQLLKHRREENTKLILSYLKPE